MELSLIHIEMCIRDRDTFFEDEHNAWERLNTELLAQGYSVEAVSYTHLMAAKRNSMRIIRTGANIVKAALCGQI